MIIEIKPILQSRRRWRVLRPLRPPGNETCLPFLLSLMMSVSVAGCSDADLPPGITKKSIAIEEVPDNLRAAAKMEIPKVEFKEAWQNLDAQGKLHSYEIRGRQSSDGKIREVRVSVTGEILETE